jgi:hypothetical protein
LVVSAALLHSVARTLQRHLQLQSRGHQEGYSRLNVPGSTF